MEKTNIMVTDDLRSIRESLKIILQDDFNVREAENGQQALEELKKGDTFIVILDVMMPDMDGIETLKKIKELNANVEVCMLTSVNDLATSRKASELGAFDYITKPFDVEKVRSTVMNMEKVIKSRLGGADNQHNYHLN